MLVIKFAIRGTKITWFINNNLIMCLSFLSTMDIGIIFISIKNKNSNKKIKRSNPTRLCH